MLKIYASQGVEREMLAFLAEFKCRVYSNKAIKGHTRKVRGAQLHKVINFPIN